MKKLAVWLMLAVMLCAVISGGCGGGSSDSSAPEQTENLNDDTGSYDPNEEARGNSGSSGREIDLSTLTANYIAQDGETLTGTLSANVKVSIADGASVTIRDVIISREKNNANKWAGLNCSGDATIILEGTNTLKGVWEDYPGIHVPEGKTLTIKGDGELTARSNGWGAGIGGGYKLNCGNIVIEGGTITAIGGLQAAGIGGGYSSDCGNITISGAKVTATKVINVPYTIGAGLNGSCGTVTIGGLEVAVSDKSFTYIGGKITDLSTIKEAYTVKDREMLTGTLGEYVKISIADGATVALWNVTINGVNNDSCRWAGINCTGDATIALTGTNTVKGFHRDCPGIHVPEGKTLTIQGTGSLTASSNGEGAGIGGGYRLPCGNVVINSGTITANGGENAAGIGTGYAAGDAFDPHCGSIAINGGKITATKGNGAIYSLGIGGWPYNVMRPFYTGVTICGAKYKADEGTFTYGFDPNTEGTFTVEIDTAAGYAVSSMSLYGRKCIGMNEDGSYKLGSWEEVEGWKVGFWKHLYSQSFKVPRKYVELGFQFDIKSRRSYVFSQPFWPTKERKGERIDSVFIDIGGVITNANILIKVNDKTVVEKYSCSIDHNYNW